MMFKTCLFLLVGYRALAAEWILDSSCGPWSTQIEDSTKEALKIAEIALGVMKDSSNDRRVQGMAKCILGENDYQNKFDIVKGVLKKIGEFSKEPSDFLGPQDEGWLGMRSNVDVEIYCDNSRITEQKDDKGKRFGTNRAHGDRIISGKEVDEFLECNDLNPPAGYIKGITTTSDLIDKKARKEAKEMGEVFTDNDYVIPTEYANTLQICRKTIQNSIDDDWGIIDRKRIRHIMRPRQIAKFIGRKRRPIDAITNMATTILHEFTHTNQAGKSFDIQTVEGKAAYGWKSCGSVKNPENGDTISLLALALNIWKIGNYYVTDNGDISSR